MACECLVIFAQTNLPLLQMSDNLGNKIRQLREAAGLKWGDLAEAAGIETSQVVLIESGEVSPAISTLIKIARRMGVRLGTLLDGAEEGVPAISNPGELKPTVNTTKAGGSNHLDFFSLAGQKSDRNMEPFMINVTYVDAKDRKNFSSHEGEEFIYVLDGTLCLYYGADSYILEAGMTIYFDSIVPHCLTVEKEGDRAQILAVTYTPN